MSRLRFVVGEDRTPSSLETFRRTVDAGDKCKRSEAELDALVTPSLSKAQIEAIAQRAMDAEIIGGCLSDPRGMLAEATGRFEEVPEGRFTQRAKDLCKQHQVEDARFTIPFEPSKDIIIVLHPKKEEVMDASGNMIPTDKYVVFAREIGGNGEDTMVPGNCYICNYADQKQMSRDEFAWHSAQTDRKPNTSAKAHNCFRRKFFPNWVPTLFAKAHGIDDAEDLAKELRSAWTATAEQAVDDNGRRDWSRITDQDLDGSNRREFSFTNDYLAGMMAANPNAWSSLSADDQSAVDCD